MIVILDTNTIIQNPKLDSDIHKVLYRYLSKTDSYLLMPEVVHQELPVVYKKRLSEIFSKVKTDVAKLNAFLTDNNDLCIEYDVNTEATKFISLVESIYAGFNKNYIASLKPGMLEESIRRAINKIRPCSENKEEFRDTLIWLTVISVAEEQDERNVVFITNNTTDFCDSDGNLHEQLKNDLQEKNINVYFYKTLNDFY